MVLFFLQWLLMLSRPSLSVSAWQAAAVAFARAADW